MNFDTTSHILWPFRLETYDPPTTCDSCMKSLDPWEVDDPIEIDGRFFCDKCADNLTHLRLEGFISGVAKKTNRLI